jgi:hypothetical protein
MKKNMGNIDRIIRLVVAAVIVGLYFTQMITGMAAIVLMILAGVFVLTSVMGLCPLYLPFNINTGAK